MDAGTRVGGRFVVEREIGRGGVGRVFRARDERTGAPAALKVLLRRSGIDEARLLREAELIAELDHPRIVRHLAHGRTDEGELWLAMEWIDGEPLGARLEQRRATVEEALALGRALAGALATIHARGIVHRDLKPSNVVLRGDTWDDVALIDFGMARGPQARLALTATGQVVGTAQYMAPEQVSGEAVDARADVWALGCVLYEALAGQRAFSADQTLAILMRVLLEEPTPIEALRDDVPAPVAALVAAMLSKRAEARPADGAAVVAELARLERASLRPDRPSLAIGSAERRVQTILLARLTERAGDAEALAARVEAAARARGGEPRFLADGTVAVRFEGGEAPTDRAMGAARLAVELRAIAPELAVAVVTGRGEDLAERPVGELIDRGVELLRTAREAAVDDSTARLLGGRFEIAERALLRELSELDVRRLVCGVAAPLVGRDWELGALEAMVDECVDEGASRVALITAAAGAGKSRLAAELAERAEARGVEVLWGRGDAMAPGSPFRPLADAIASDAGLDALAAADARRARLRAHVADLVGETEADRVAELLGEMIGVPFDDEGSERLRAARRDPRLMSDGMRAAFEDFLRARCERAPLLMVVDDLQWAGAPTVSFLDSALRRADDRPLVVLGLARPEVEQAFPGLWEARHVQVIRLRPLVKRAAAALVRAVLPDAEPALVERIVARAGGHAFHLEELIRAAADGAEQLPDTVLGMVAARLDALDAGLRRVLRGASVFGDTFWGGGVRAVTGAGEALDAQLAILTQHELVAPRAKSAVPGEAEHAFRNALVREATYASLTDEDRALAHRAAGAWLEDKLPDARVLAEHFDRGEAPDRAVPWYRRAAASALAGYDPPSALALADRGLALGATDLERARLELVRAEAHHVRGDYDEATRAAEAARDALAPSTAHWFHALHLSIAASASLGRIDAVLDGAARARGAEAAEPRAVAAQVRCLAEATGQLLLVGQREVAGEVLDRAHEVAARVRDLEPHAAALLAWATSHRALHEGDLVAYLRGLEGAALDFERAGDMRYVAGVRTGIGYACTELGLYERAEAELREALATAEKLALPRTVCAALNNLGNVLTARGRPEEARDVERRAVELSVELDNRRFAGGSRAYLALALLALGDLDAAAVEARTATAELDGVTPVLPLALGAEGKIALARGDHEAAREALSRALAILDEGHAEAGDALVREAWAALLREAGDEAGARAAEEAARARLEARAAKIADPAIRDAFLRAHG